MKHPHVEILIALANGYIAPDVVELRHTSWEKDWAPLTAGYSQWIYVPEEWQVRIKPKPKTIKFNGVELPEPLLRAPEQDSIVYVSDIMSKRLYLAFKYSNLLTPQSWLKQGLLHSTKENAIAWAKAMIPFKQED